MTDRCSAQCHDLHTVIVVGLVDELPDFPGLKVLTWEAICSGVGLNERCCAVTPQYCSRSEERFTTFRESIQR